MKTFYTQLQNSVTTHTGNDDYVLDVDYEFTDIEVAHYWRDEYNLRQTEYILSLNSSGAKKRKKLRARRTKLKKKMKVFKEENGDVFI